MISVKHRYRSDKWMKEVLLLATKNKGKIQELQQLLTPLGYNVESIHLLYPHIREPEENSTTFLENARLKAQYYMKYTHRPCIADDSGLCVEGLGGQPGIYSARYAGKHGDDAANNRKLVREIKSLSIQQRRAEYICELVLLYPDGREILARGQCAGIIQETPAGTNGFGYDPYFYVPLLQKTMAELSPVQKNAISHRGQALRHLIDQLILDK